MDKLLDALDDAADDDDFDPVGENKSALTRLEGKSSAGYWKRRTSMRKFQDVLDNDEEEDE